jgi:hypothetical protein
VESTHHEAPHYEVSPASCQFIPLKIKHFPQHSVLTPPLSVVLPSYERPNFTPYKTAGRVSLVYFNLYIVIWQMGRYKILTEWYQALPVYSLFLTSL